MAEASQGMTFSLKITTMDRGLRFDGVAEKVILRTVTGDVAILPRHTDFIASLGMGEILVETNGQRKRGVCIGGIVTVTGGHVTLLPTTFEWAEEIDPERARQAEAMARKTLAAPESFVEEALAQAHLKRALLRQKVFDDQIAAAP